MSRTAVTVANGTYSFANLRPGTYTLAQTQPAAGYFDGADTIGSLGGTSPGKNRITVVVGAGQAGTGYDFGELPAAPGVAGSVYLDANGNGVRDAGEGGIADGAVTIAGTAWAGTPFARPRTAADVAGGSLTVRTAADGTWAFGPLTAGTYTLTEAQPAGFDDGAEANGDAAAPGVVVGNDVFSNVVLSPAAVMGPLTFGERTTQPTGTAVVAGTAFLDLDRDRDGALDPAEPGVPGVTAELRDAAGPGLGGGPRVDVIDTAARTPRASIFAYEPEFRGGVRVAAFDRDADGFDELATRSGYGGGPRLRVLDGRTFTSLLDEMVADAARRDGMFVG